VVRPRSCRVIYYCDTPALRIRHQLFDRVREKHKNSKNLNPKNSSLLKTQLPPLGKKKKERRPPLLLTFFSSPSTSHNRSTPHTRLTQSSPLNRSLPFSPSFCSIFFSSLGQQHRHKPPFCP